MTLNLNELAGLAWSQLWQVTALAAVVAILVRLLCRQRPHLAYVLWMLVVLKCLAPPLWSSPTGVFSWAQSRIAQIEPAIHADISAASRPTPELRQVATTTAEQPDRVHAASKTTASTPPVAAPEPVRRYRWSDVSLTRILATLWLAGALGLAGLFLRKWLLYCRVLKQSAIRPDPAIEALAIQLSARLGLRRKVSVLATFESIGPAVFGPFRPVIVLPHAVLAGKTPQQIEPILAHELVHVRRGDTYWGMLQLATEILWWFHPLVWWANRETCRERERCCDEEVVAGLKCRPAVYARCLLDVLELERNWQPILAIPGARSVEITSKRLEDIMVRADSFHTKTPRWSWALLAIAAILVLPGRALVLGQSEAPSAHQQKETPQMVKHTARPTDIESIVTGTVVDPAGTGMSGVPVAIVGRRHDPVDSRDNLQILAETKTDAKGCFRLATARLPVSTFDADIRVIAQADGYAVAWRPIALPQPQQEVAIQLTEERTVYCRVVENGQPAAANVKLVVTSMSIVDDKHNWDGIFCGEESQLGPFWPGPFVTDENGNFTVRGIGPNQRRCVEIHDDRFARDSFEIGPGGKGILLQILMAPPARIFEGRVVYADTRKPAANARVEVGASGKFPANNISTTFGQTDAAGHFRINPHSGKFFFFTVKPPDAEPYLVVERQIELPQPATLPKIEIALPRGVLVRGRITESASGEPVAGARIQYQEHSKNKYAPNRIMNGWVAPREEATSGADGTFRIAVTPGRGTLFIQGPGGDYIYQMIAPPEFAEGNAGGQRYYVNAFVPLDLKLESEPAELNIAIRRGVTVKGRIVGPDDRPVDEAQLISCLLIPPGEFTFRLATTIARGGEFELHGLDPDKAVPVYFLDSKNELGATMEISGKSAEKQPLVVRLSPCGKAVARFVRPEGKPMVKYKPDLRIVVTPGPFQADDKRAMIELNADQEYVANFDRAHYWEGPLTDDEGRYTMPALIPGATYRILLYRKPGEWDEKDFTVKSGETLQLPDIVVPPQS